MSDAQTKAPPKSPKSEGTAPMPGLRIVSDEKFVNPPEVAPGTIERRPLRFILRAIGKHKLGHLVIFLSVVTAVGCAVGSQYAIKNMVDVLARHNTGAIWGAFAVLAGLIAADNLSWRVGGWMAARSFVAVTGDLRRTLFDHLLGHAPGYFAERRPGMLAGRISATGNAVFRIESLTAWNVLPPLFGVLGAIGVIATVDPLMGAVLVGVAVVLGLILAKMADAGRSLHHEYATAAATVDGELVDVINNVGVVRAFGASLRERHRFAADVDREMSARRDSLRYLEKLRIFHAVTTAGLTACLLAWALTRWVHGLATPGDVVLIATLGFTVLHGTRDLAVALVEMVQDWARLNDALTSLLVPHDMPDDPSAPALEAPHGGVRFDDIDFDYAGARPVLRRFSLEIAPGERVGLVGRSGSGKTTLLALLQRQYDVERGRILIDGADIASLSRASLADAISVVSQDVQLFHRSVLENIRYGKPGASDREVREAARAAHADAFIETLPDGYKTLVGERGMKLSGGQRQRIAIARAFLRDAPILLLDEATSALDSESEAGVQEALDKLAAGRTVIAVAHRLSTLRDFDRIVVMEDGSIIDDGAPSVLARRPGPYRDLLRHQGLHIIAA
ncbi:ABC transporter ATP-binding protein/permease [Acidiphilium sp. AL]|nr:ABC transporter ATP-binding protein/permease [Acidiphilium sp. AL]